MSKSIYLANPYGFSAQQRDFLLPPIVEALTGLGLEVREPFSRVETQIDMSSPIWPYRVGQLCVSDVRETDAIFAIVNGCPPDEGVMVELGVAIALEKRIFLFRDDFRRSSDTDMYPLNLMVFAGLSDMAWQNDFYQCVEHVSSPERSLARWAKS